MLIDIEVKTPEFYAELPSVDVEAPKVELELTEAKIISPGVNLPTVDVDVTGLAHRVSFLSLGYPFFGAKRQKSKS